MNIPIDISTVTLHTQRLTLRPFCEEDLQDFHTYAKEEGVGQMAGWLPHKSPAETALILQSFITGKKTFAIVKDGTVIGSLGIEQYKEDRFPEFKEIPARELGFVLAKPYWGQGLMPEAVQEVIRYLFEETACEVLLCGYFVHNTRSAAVQRKCGFVPYAKGTFKTVWGEDFEDRTGILTKDAWLRRK